MTDEDPAFEPARRVIRSIEPLVEDGEHTGFIVAGADLALLMLGADPTANTQAVARALFAARDTAMPGRDLKLAIDDTSMRDMAVVWGPAQRVQGPQFQQAPSAKQVAKRNDAKARLVRKAARAARRKGK